MKTKLLTVASLVGAILILIHSCDNKDESSPEFVASSSEFENFRSWPEAATNVGPDPALGTAHEGNDEMVSRTIYVKDDQDREANGRFPVGTIIVKDIKRDGSTIGVTALVKRGNRFNPDHNDWEWFILNQDGTIKIESGVELRGAKLMNGGCGACHSQVKDQDFVFSK